MASRIAEVPLDILFSLLNLTDAESEWSFYVNYRAAIPNHGLADTLYGAGEPAIPLSDMSDVAGAARVLIEEMRSHVPAAPTIEVGGVIVPLSGGMTGVSHYIRWSDFDTTEVRWVRHYRMGNENYEARPKEGGIALGDLSSASRAAVKQLDARATEVAYARFAAKVANAAALPPGVGLVPKRRKVFISYRSGDMPVAEALHRRLDTYGNGAVFEPYLDRHSLVLGDLRQHLKERIVQSDLFVPVVSDIYAAAHSVSAEEFTWAREAAAARGGLERFVAPVFLGRPSTPVATDLAGLVRLEIDGVASLAEGEKRIEDFLKMCAIPYAQT